MVRSTCYQPINSAYARNTITQHAVLVFLCSLLLGTCTWADQLSPSNTRLLTLDSQFNDAGAHWTVLSLDDQSMRIEMHLSSLRVQDEIQDNVTWQILSIDRGGLSGKAGTPGLPTTSHLVAVPAGMFIEARVINYEIHEVKDLLLWPVQPASEGEFCLEQSAYLQTEWHEFKPAASVQALRSSAFDAENNSAGPAVYLGAVAIIAGQAVVPVSVGPVSYDPVSRTAKIANNVEIEIRFATSQAGGGLKSPSNSQHSTGPAFRSLLQERIIGFAENNGKEIGSPELGTWAIVCHDPEVEGHLASLINWRQRQGYHVEVIVTSGTAESIKAQLQVIYDDQSLPPLEFIVLAGDTESAYLVPTWNEQLSGYGGEGDHYYTTLDGDDILADAHVGRLSFTSMEMLDTIVNKIIGYEQTPPMDDTSWYQKACIIGDPTDSGITTIYVNQWLKGQLLANAYTEVDTIWGGNFVGLMMASVNEGISAFGYRGYLNMSGIAPGHINALSNGGRLPVAILPTCETGSFEGSFPCHSEAWLRAPGGGAIAAVATATSGTHTRYNNCFYQGIWDGLLNGDDPRIGPAHTLGKIELYTNYYLAEPETAEVWSVWNNIMGDCASQVWQSVPRVLNVSHPATVSVGSGTVEVLVQSDGIPVAEALVCLNRPGEVQLTGRTNSSGFVLLTTPALNEGPVYVTVTGPDLLPYMGGLNVGTVDVFCGLADIQIYDGVLGIGNGNGDSLLNPGEVVGVSLAVTNHGLSTAFGIEATMTGGQPWSIIDDADLYFGEVAPGETVWCQASAIVSIDNAAPDATTISWPLQVTDGTNIWTSMVQAPVHAAAFSVADLDWSAGSTFMPGQSGQLIVHLLNDGSTDADAIEATLSTDSPWVDITKYNSNFGRINTGFVGSNTLSPFEFNIRSACYPGHLAVFRLDLTYRGGVQSFTEFTITVGTADADDPSGPDGYGYYAFDNSDTESFYAPVYDWVAIDPDHTGLGVDVGLSDFGWEQDDTETIDLPFTFSYYGTDFDQASICSNGWLAMGETPLVHYRNFSIPSKGSPGSMIAPFWDNLKQSGTRSVYTYYDEVAHRFIIQWYLMDNYYSSAPQNFEVILLDPLWYPTATGDGIIIFQYETVNNTDARDGFATVGIQNHDRTDGMLYSYWNQYVPGAAALQSGRAIRFQPMSNVEVPIPRVAPSSITTSMGFDESAQHTIHIGNSSPEPSLLSYKMKILDPATLVEMGADKDIDGSTMALATDQYEPGTTVDIVATIHAMANYGFLSVASLLIPPGVTLNSSEDFLRDGNDCLFWEEQTGEGVLTSWDGLSGGMLYYVPNGESAVANLNLTFDSDLTGDLEFDYTLKDLGYFSEPDVVTGTIVLTNDNASVRVFSPESETVAVIGEVLDIQYEMLNASGLVDIFLQRDPGGSWETLATALDATAGTWPWLVHGLQGPYAVIRLVDNQDAEVFDDSEIFVVSRNLDWLYLSQTEGNVSGDQTVDVILTINTAGLSASEYEAVIVLETNYGETLTVPIDLLVADLSGVQEGVPDAVALLGNYPNPFNPHTTFSFTLPSEMQATMEIFSARGMRVRSLLNGRQVSGVHHVMWDGLDGNGRAVPSGVYFCRLVTPEKTLTEKLVLAK